MLAAAGCLASKLILSREKVLGTMTCTRQSPEMANRMRRFSVTRQRWLGGVPKKWRPLDQYGSLELGELIRVSWTPHQYSQSAQVGLIHKVV